MRSAIRVALATGLVLGTSGLAVAGSRSNNAGSGLNPQTQLTGNDRSAGINSGNFDPYLPSRLREYGYPGSGDGRPAYGRRYRMPYPYEGYPY